MNDTLLRALTAAACLAFAGSAAAHFQMIIPSDDMVSNPTERNLNLEVKFWHPFEGHGMPMGKPVRFGMRMGGENTDLLNGLKSHQFNDIENKAHAGYKLNYSLKKPGDHIFYVEPQPFWEASEETFIVHYTKVVVNGYGMEQGWDDEVGLKAEIMPLTRPYGLYTGNVFQGMVKVQGEPVPYTEVEVEYYNEKGTLKAPADPMITQVIKTDGNGVFTYAMPKAGWWGFAALTEDEKTMQHEGREYPVEIGAVIWVRTHDME